MVEPGQPFVDGWHIREICRHLEACTRFEIPRLLINVPPRHTKSIICSVMWPAWVWASHPERRFIFLSYSGQLALRDAVKMRTLIESDLYQETFRPDWTLKEDQNTKGKFENEATGFRFSTSIGGTLTGEGGDYVLIDDPLNANDSNSEAVRLEACNVVTQVLSTRVNNPKRYSKVMIMQRLHEEDPSGAVLKEKNPDHAWDRLILQARYEPNPEIKSRTKLGFIDPRTKPGELLWPERFDETSIKGLENDLQDQAHAQLQQSPKSKSGGLFNREWWLEFEKWPDTLLEVVQFWDCAQKPGISNDYSVCSTWIRSPAGFFIVDVWRDKVDTPTLEAMAVSLAAKYKPDAIVIEDKSAGSSLIQYLLRGTTLPVLPYNPTRDKEVRASAATPMVKAKKVLLPKFADWKEDFKKEHEKFPMGGNDDQVDTTSMAVEYFNKKVATEPRVRSL